MGFFKFYSSYIYFLLLIYLVFFSERRRHITMRIINIIPLKNIITYFSGSNYKQSGEVISFYSNFLGNIILFIPFSIILIWAYSKIRMKTILFIALITSILIETMQFIFRVGVADIDDVLLNVTGAFAGIILYKLYKMLSPNFIHQIS